MLASLASLSHHVQAVDATLLAVQHRLGLALSHPLPGRPGEPAASPEILQVVELSRDEPAATRQLY